MNKACAAACADIHDRSWPSPALLPHCVVVLMGLILGGCASRTPPASPLVVPCIAQQAEIDRLQQTLGDRDTEIARLQAHQQGQTKILEDTTTEAARAKVKLRRLATQADAASAVAEAEVALDTLTAARLDRIDAASRAQARQILGSASAAFDQGDYSSAVDLAAQSRQLVDMINALRKHGAATHSTVQGNFQIPIPLRVTRPSRRHGQPSVHARVLDYLPADAPVVATAYQGHWLKVETADDRLGWIFRGRVTTR